MGGDVHPASPIRDRDGPVCRAARDVCRGPIGSEAGSVRAYCLPVPVNAVFQVGVDRFDQPRHLGVAASQVLGLLVVPRQGERAEVPGLRAVEVE